MVKDTVRAFLAIELSRETKNEADEFIQKLQFDLPEFRFISPRNWHLTLHFLDETPLEKIDRLRSCLPEVLTQIETFVVLLEGIGGFPNNHKPRLLWVGAETDSSHLLKLKKSLDQALEKMHFEIEKREFHPHVTFARLKKNESPKVLNINLNFKGRVYSQVSQITLFKSVLSTTGAEYTPLETFRFGK